MSASPYEHMLGKPDVKYIGNIHGNEAVGRELLLHLIEYFVTSYHSDPYIKWLLDNTRIHIMPSMNPDGYAASREGECEGGKGRYVKNICTRLFPSMVLKKMRKNGIQLSLSVGMTTSGDERPFISLHFLSHRNRSNSKGYDLNRNFPDYFKQNTKRTQPETEAVKDWISKIQFLLSGSLHGGALVCLILSVYYCHVFVIRNMDCVNRLLSTTVLIEFVIGEHRFPDFH